MKSSGTTKTKKVTNKKTTKKVSTSPSSSNTKKKSNVKSKVQPKNAKKPVKKVAKKTQQAPRKKQVVHTNNHSAKNNVRLNRIEDEEYVPFLDGDNYIEQVTPNTLKMVAPDDDIEDLYETKPKKRIKPITVVKLVFLIGILIGAGYLMFTLDTFKLEKIEVKGNEKYTAEEIINKIDLNIGENVFKQLILSDRFAIGLAYVSKVNYGYSFPNTIIVKVKERYPAYIAKNKSNDKYYKLDNEGYLLEECNLSTEQAELVVEGFEFGKEPNLGQKIDDSYVKKLDIYNNVKKLLKEHDIQGEITNVRFNASLTIVTLDGKLRITFANDSNLEYKVSFLKSIIEKNGGTVEGAIDMSVENPVYSKYN